MDLFANPANMKLKSNTLIQYHSDFSRKMEQFFTLACFLLFVGHIEASSCINETDTCWETCFDGMYPPKYVDEIKEVCTSFGILGDIHDLLLSWDLIPVDDSFHTFAKSMVVGQSQPPSCKANIITKHLLLSRDILCDHNCRLGTRYEHCCCHKSRLLCTVLCTSSKN